MTLEHHFYAVDAGFQQVDCYNKLHDLILAPESNINRAFRSSRLALKSVLNIIPDDRISESFRIDDIFVGLKKIVRDDAQDLVLFAGLLGSDLAYYLVDLYDIEVPESDLLINVNKEVDWITGYIDDLWKRAKYFYAYEETQAEEFLLGNGIDTLGIITAVAINRQLELATMQKAAEVQQRVMNQAVKDIQNQLENNSNAEINRRTPYKQVVAAIDPRTTRCCLEAHGQIQPFDGKFTLTGNYFSPEMDWTPFHWNCRSSVVMSFGKDDLNDDITKAMQTAADDELAWRNDNWKTMDRRPAHDKRDLGGCGKRWRDYMRESKIGNRIMNRIRQEFGTRKKYYYKPQVPSSALISTRTTDYLRGRAYVKRQYNGLEAVKNGYNPITGAKIKL